MRIGMKTWNVVRISLFIGAFSFAAACGSDKKDDDDDDAPAGKTVAYSTVSTIVKDSCVAAACHATGGTGGDLSTEALLDAKKATAVKRIKGTEGAPMPTAGTEQATAFSADDKVALLKYLEQ